MQAEDPLSRRPDHKNRVELNNAKKVLLKPEFFTISTINTFYKLVFNDSKILREIKIALKQLKVLGVKHFQKSSSQNNLKKLLFYELISFI